MSLKSISLVAALAGAMFLVGCGDSDSGPTNYPPQASLPAGAPFSINSPGDIPFLITLSASDANGDALTYHFDTTSDQGGTIVDDPVDGLPKVEYTPLASWVTLGGGVDYFTFYVTDAFGIPSNVVTVYIAVDNDAPVAQGQGPLTTAEDTGLAITLTGTDPDPSDTMTFIYSQPSNGTVSGSPPDVTYTPALNWSGTDSFTFTASDGVLTSAPATVTIDVTPVNDAPVAANDVVTTGFETAVDINVLANDHDVDNVPADLTVTIVTAPANGTAVLNLDNTITYTPNTMFFGHDFIEYEVSDTEPLTSNTARVNITVSNPLCDVWAWGKNEIGELGIGETGTLEQDPRPVLYIRYGWHAWGGDKFTIFYDSYRNMWTCGTNNNGELADPFAPSRDYPRQPVVGGSDVEAGTSHGLCSTGTAPNSFVKAWGVNADGRLGDGGVGSGISPVLVLTEGPPVAPLKGATAVGAGRAHSLAVTFQIGLTGDDEWRVYSWGANNNGQLGLGNLDQQNHATEIAALRGANLTGAGGLVASHGGDHVVDVVACFDHSLALDNAGNVYAWGQDIWGATGDGGGINDPPDTLPVYIIGGCKQIAAGRYFSLAVSTGGTLYGWGRCEQAEMGHYHIPLRYEPWPIAINVAGQEVLHVAAGNEHALAATHEIVDLDRAELGNAIDNMDGTYTVNIQPSPAPSLGTTGWMGGTVTNVTRGNEVAFITQQINEYSVRVIDAGLGAFNPATWTNFDELWFHTEDWHVYAWGDNSQLQCAQVGGQMNAPTLVNGLWEGVVQRRPIRVGAGLYNSFAIIQRVTVLAP